MWKLKDKRKNEKGGMWRAESLRGDHKNNFVSSLPQTFPGRIEKAKVSQNVEYMSIFISLFPN